MRTGRDVLDLSLAAVLEIGFDLAFDLAVDLAGDQDAAGIAQRFEPGGDVDALAIDVAAILDDDVAHVQPDPQLERAGCAAHVALDRHRAAQRRDRAGKFCQKTVTRGLDQASLPLGKPLLDHLAPQLADARVGAFLVALHLRRKADDIGSQNGRQFALNGRFVQPGFPFRKVAPSNHALGWWTIAFRSDRPLIRKDDGRAISPGRPRSPGLFPSPAPACRA